MATNVVSARYNPRVINDNLSLYFDAANDRSYPGSGSTWSDISGFGRNGALNNSPTFNSLGASSYFTFDGIDDNLTTSYSITSTPALGNWTFEVWTELTDYPTSAGTVFKSGTLFGAINNSGAALYWYGNTSGTECVIYGIVSGNNSYKSTPGFGLQLNKTHQLTLVNDYSGGSIALYVDGKYFSGTTSATQEYNAGNVSGLNIGMAQPQTDGSGGSALSYYPGRIKTAKIYSAALTAAQVSQNYIGLRGRYGA